MTDEKYWIGVASKDHVQRGIKDGIMQLGHGKRAPLARLKKGDWIVYYSPVEVFGDKTPLQAFTAIGQVHDDVIYQQEVSDTFIPFRRRVDYLHVTDAPIRPLIPQLSFITSKERWGYVFRFGLVQISAEDFAIIKQAMVSINH